MKYAWPLFFTLLAACSLAISVIALAAWFLRTSGSDYWIWEWQTPPTVSDPFYRWGRWQVTFAGGAIAFDRDRDARYAPDAGERNARPINRFKHEVDIPQPPPSVTRSGSWTVNSKVYQYKSKIYLLSGKFGIGASRLDFLGWTRRYWAVRCPLWFVMVAAAIPALAWEIRYRKRLRRQWRTWRGFCANCGYDLRATPDRCPECGTIPPKKPATSK